MGVELLLVSGELEIGSLHVCGNLLLLGLASSDGLGVGLHLLVVLGKTGSGCLLCRSTLVGHGGTDALHLGLEMCGFLHHRLLGHSSLVHGLEGSSGVCGESLAGRLHTLLHGPGSMTLLLIETAGLGTEVSLLLGPELLSGSGTLGDAFVGAGMGTCVPGRFGAHDLANKTLVEGVGPPGGGSMAAKTMHTARMFRLWFFLGGEEPPC